MEHPGMAGPDRAGPGMAAQDLGRPASESGAEFVSSWRRNAEALAGSYDPAQEHDACGVGLVAALDGRKRRDVVEAGIAALKAV